MATLRDVAKAAGVSITTVSLVINGKSEQAHISPQTAQRVLQVVQELDYRANLSARSLRSNAPPRPKLLLFWPMDSRTEILGFRLNNINKALEDLRFDCELSVQLYHNGSLEKYVSPLLSGTCNGAIIGGTNQADLEYLDTVTLLMPVILLNATSGKYNCVSVDNSRMGRLAAELIYQKGYRETAVLLSETPPKGTKERMQVFLDSCAELGVKVRPEWQFSAAEGLEGGMTAAQAYIGLPDRPRMLFSSNAGMAQGAISALYHSGLVIGRDLELLTFSSKSDEANRYLTPSLSSVDIPARIDSLAAHVLVEKVRYNDLTPKQLLLEPEVHLRESFTL